ncbi:hypothetical protein TESG_08462 [Trichophyton tonsurans CBS 112818]|uniref:Uncharacterized protein n=1 Tax=Trichophyton tonsurans (strain CBS 112818) TaxID=647933 RepID=F2RZQ3_TRIT1|nr:hypothetical protein TESG_08462 [Trichophyton tonsurans CBS 112818]
MSCHAPTRSHCSLSSPPIAAKLEASVTGKRLLPANRLVVTLIHAIHHTPMGPHKLMMKRRSAHNNRAIGFYSIMFSFVVIVHLFAGSSISHIPASPFRTCVHTKRLGNSQSSAALFPACFLSWDRETCRASFSSSLGINIQTHETLIASHNSAAPARNLGTKAESDFRLLCLVSIFMQGPRPPRQAPPLNITSTVKNGCPSLNGVIFATIF